MRKSIILLILLMIGSFFIVFKEDVYAAVKTVVDIEHPKNVYYTLTGGGKNISKQFTHYSLNGDVVFCIEPGVQITDWDYVGESGFINSPFSTEINKKMELIGHYGYDYPNHQTEKYRMATQALIWETVGNHTVKFYTKIDGEGDSINIDIERQTIMALVNSHYTKPSFSEKKYDVELGKNLVIEDNNNLLNEYEIYDNGGNEVILDGNKITIFPKNVNKSKIILIRKKYDNTTTFIFNGVNGTSQKLGLFRFSDPVLASIELNITGGQVSIEKIDSETGLSIGQGDGVLQGAIYGIYDENNVLLTKLTTDKNGKATSNYLNKVGRFTLKEISSSKGYLLDNKVYEFEISADNPSVNLKLKEQVIKNTLKLYKVLSSNRVKIIRGEADISFDIYLKSTGNLYKTITTDKDGYASIDLPYGTYVIHQKNTTKDYQKVEDFEFIVNESGITEKTIYNKAIEARLKLIKIDEETGQSIKMSGINFRIKDLQTNKYLCPDMYLPRSLDVCSFSTNEEGILITPFELVGDYQLEEVDQKNDGYLWNENKIIFHVGEGSQFEIDKNLGKLFVVKFSNKAVKGKVIINKIGQQVNINNGTYNYEEVKLSNVKFGLYDSKNILVKEVVTNKDGYAEIENLSLGKYYLKELESSNNNAVDTNVYDFELTYKDQYTPIITKTFNLKNYYNKGKLEFTKIDLVDGSVIPNTEIEIYTDENELVYHGVTDEQGKIIIDDLFVGKFYIVEKNSATGYVLSKEKMFFEIKENGEIVKATMTNEKIKGDLEFTKIDFSTSEPLSNTTIEIYNISDEVVFTGVTDESGKIFINELEYGKYYILEKEAPDGYLLNTEKMYFEIKTNGEIVKATMTNDRYVEVPNTLSETPNFISIVSILFAITGIILIITFIARNNSKVYLLVLGIVVALTGVLIYVGEKVCDVYLTNLDNKLVETYFLDEEGNSKIVDELESDEVENKINSQNNNSGYIGVLEIPKISVKRGFFKINDIRNNVNKNIQVITKSEMPNVKNGNLIIAAHSGNSRVAYFKNLYKLINGDEVFVYFNDIKYIYKVVNKYEVDKIGKVPIRRDVNENVLTLITCSRVDKTKQIVYICELIEEEKYE